MTAPPPYPDRESEGAFEGTGRGGAVAFVSGSTPYGVEPR